MRKKRENKMSDEIKIIERQVHRAILYEDGLTDIGWGFIFLAIGIIPALQDFGHSPYWGFLLFLAPSLLHYFGRKLITVPRLGFIKFNLNWRLKQKRLRIFLIIIAVLTAVFVLLTYYQLLPEAGDLFGPHTFMVYIGLGVLCLLSIIAFITDFTRLYFYALLIGVGLPLGEFLNTLTGRHWGELLFFGAASLVVFAVGLILLLRFLMKYPKPNSEILHE
jgi:hypothetical protein